MMNCKQWKDALTPIVENTEYEVLCNKEPASGQEDTIIKRKNQNKPQYIKIFPKQSGTGIVLDAAVKTKVEGMMDLQKEDTFKGNEYHYKNVTDEFVTRVCSLFVSDDTTALNTNVTEWFISGNPTQYDIEGAFHKLGKLDWKQSTNVAAGDIVYIYVSQGVYAVKFKCRANKVDLVDVDIDDKEFNLSGEYDGTYGRYMELELIEELKGAVYSKTEMEKHGFRSPQSPVRVPAETKEYLYLVQKLQHSEEMDPDKHDGSYELMRETIEAYKNKGNLSDCDYKDLNLVYLTCVGTWKQGIDAKKKTVHESHLPDAEKERLVDLIDSVWNRTKSGAYNNHDGKGEIFGMFGTGFYTFMGKTDEESPRNFIQMCIDIKDMTDDEEMFARCERTLNADFHGMRAASASMVLHCLNPMTFPIFNSNMGSDNLYVYFNLDIKWKTELYSYIKNARIVKSFRDDNFTIKNYRIFDIAAWSLGSSKQHTRIDYLGILDYLENNQEVAYSNPEAAGVESAEKSRLLEVKAKGQSAITEMKKMVEVCKERFKLDRLEPMSWLDGSNTKTRKYLWAQMKYSKFADNPISISIFAEISPLLNKARYRYSLEIKNDGTDKKQIEKYHSFLDMPLQPESSLVYVVGSNELGKPDTVDETAEEIKGKLKDGTYSKVQLCKIEEWADSSTNDEFEASMIEGIQELLPYYEFVVEAIPTTYWPSLDEYDPGITKEKWLKLLNNPEVTYEANLSMFKMMLELGGESTCANLASQYSGSPGTYNGLGRAFGERVHKITDCPLCMDEERERYYTIPFVGRNVNEDGKPRYSWKLRDELKEALESMDLSNVNISGLVENTEEFDKNMILYGPPGTGKTYNTTIYAVAVCDNLSVKAVSKKPYSEVMKRYKQLKEVEKRVTFTTFHQSYGYEEFIEGIKPKMDNDSQDVEYTIKDGVFKAFCDRAGQIKVKTSRAVVSDNARIWNVILGGKASPELKQICFKEGSIRIGWSEQPEIITDDLESVNDKERRILLNFQDEIAEGDIVVSRYNHTSIDGIGIVKGECEFDDFVDGYPRKRDVDWIYTGEPIDIISLNGGTRLDRKSVYALDRVNLADLLGLIPESKDTELDVQDQTKPYVFIIDEINRGNISKIFGELITLIEPTKRKGEEEAMEAMLPYSNKPFGVPSNVYIIGTMNTADRSIALMDTALRRRFQFEEMMPNMQVLRDLHADKVEKNGVVLDVAEMLESINQRIEYLYDREHTIGHAFFTELKDDPTVEKLAHIFMKSVIPLLQEYFYEDYSKIMLVLGENGKKNDEDKFILAKETKANTIFRGDASDIDIPDYSYEIQKDAFYNINSYVEIKG